MVKYTFQAIAREDKGTVLGVDYNKSPSVDFRTERRQKEENLAQPEAEKESKGDGNDQGLDGPRLLRYKRTCQPFLKVVISVMSKTRWKSASCLIF
jgi:hypothetical protein